MDETYHQINRILDLRSFSDQTATCVNICKDPLMMLVALLAGKPIEESHPINTMDNILHYSGSLYEMENTDHEDTLVKAFEEGIADKLKAGGIEGYLITARTSDVDIRQFANYIPPDVNISFTLVANLNDSHRSTFDRFHAGVLFKVSMSISAEYNEQNRMKLDDLLKMSYSNGNLNISGALANSMHIRRIKKERDAAVPLLAIGLGTEYFNHVDRTKFLLSYLYDEEFRNKILIRSSVDGFVPLLSDPLGYGISKDMNNKIIKYFDRTYTYLYRSSNYYSSPVRIDKVLSRLANIRYYLENRDDPDSIYSSTGYYNYNRPYLTVHGIKGRKIIRKRRSSGSNNCDILSSLQELSKFFALNIIYLNKMEKLYRGSRGQNEFALEIIKDLKSFIENNDEETLKTLISINGFI